MLARMSDADVAPTVVVISGPNGAGKSTAAPRLLRGKLAVSEFVNADAIARGISAFEPERVAVQAGRVTLTRLDELADERRSFAFETTLASRTFAPRVRRLIREGYSFHLVYPWLPSPDLAIARVAARVQAQGHFVPDNVVRRRRLRGLSNFFNLYQPLVAGWTMYDNSDPTRTRVVAAGSGPAVSDVFDPALWGQIRREGSDVDEQEDEPS